MNTVFSEMKSQAIQMAIGAVMATIVSIGDEVVSLLGLSHEPGPPSISQTE